MRSSPFLVLKEAKRTLIRARVLTHAHVLRAACASLAFWDLLRAPRASTMPVRIKRVFAWCAKSARRSAPLRHIHRYIFACLAIAVATILAAARARAQHGRVRILLLVCLFLVALSNHTKTVHLHEKRPCFAWVGKGGARRGFKRGRLDCLAFSVCFCVFSA